MIFCPKCDDDFYECDCEFTDAEAAEIIEDAENAEIEREAADLFSEVKQ